MSDDEAAGSPQQSLSGFSSLFSISSTTPHPHPPAAHPHRLDLPCLSLSIGTGAPGEDQASSDEDQRSSSARVRMMKNRESALRSRARKRAYVQELEKEVRRLVDDNLKLKRQCKQLKTEMAALIQQQQQPTSDRQQRVSSPRTGTGTSSSTRF